MSFMILNCIELLLYLFTAIKGLLVYRKIDNRLDRVFEDKKELIKKFRGYHITLVQLIITVSIMYICGVSMWFYDHYITMQAQSATAEELVWFINESAVALVFIFALDIVDCANMTWADVSTMRRLKFRFFGEDDTHSVMCSVPDGIRTEEFDFNKPLVGSRKTAAEPAISELKKEI